METMGGKLIVGDFSNKGGQGESLQPALGKPLRFSLSPQMFRECVLYDCDVFSVHYSSQIDPDIMVIDDGYQTESRGNHVLLVSVTWSEDLDSDDEFEENEDSSFYYGHIVEIKMDGVFMHAIFGQMHSDYYQQAQDEDSRRRAEEAFVRASALIGVRVSRELIISGS